MENLPKNVINQIMFCLSHPVADIVRESDIFKYMEQLHNDGRPHNPQRHYVGCPAHCGYIDACHPREMGKVWDPRKFEVFVSKRVKNRRWLEEEEHKEYEIAWKHSTRPYYPRRLPDLTVFWKIKGREVPENLNETLELESDSNYARSDNADTSESDSD